MLFKYNVFAGEVGCCVIKPYAAGMRHLSLQGCIYGVFDNTTPILLFSGSDSHIKYKLLKFNKQISQYNFTLSTLY
jgi:hypothetical protein